jgi:site-specific DNA-methyltransferase (adenine-specific)
VAGRRKPTATSNFGVSRRESHDASDFYARFTPPELADPDDVDIEADKAIDDVFVGDSRDMAKVPDRSVALVVTSPPYFAGKEYEQALGEGHVPGTYLDYLQMLTDVFAECARTLEPGGRIAVNVANLGRKPYRSLSADVIDILQNRLRLLLRGEILWQKARGSAGNCAWGSFQKPANPVVRDLTERVVVASKGRFDRAIEAPKRARLGLPSVGSMSRDEFMEATTDVWELLPERATRVGHPAPFPVELPLRLIHLYTYYDDLVLDPFMGSGTTAVAAVRTGRHFVGYDTDPAYVTRALERVTEERARAATDGPRFVVPAVRTAATDATAAGDATQALRDGLAAKEIAGTLLRDAGFAVFESPAKAGPGIQVTFRARDAHDRAWLFDVWGGFTTSRPGLARAETLWRALGRAAVVHEADPGTPLVLLTSDLPARASTNAQALRAMTGTGKAVAAVVELASPTAVDTLRTLGDERPENRSAP